MFPRLGRHWEAAKRSEPVSRSKNGWGGVGWGEGAGVGGEGGGRGGLSNAVSLN